MKNPLLITLFTILALTAQSQVRFGLKLGASTTDLNVGELQLLGPNGNENLGIALEEARYGIHGGIMVQIRLGTFLIQPEVLFNSNSVDFEVTDLDNPGTITEVFTEKYQYLDIPLLLGTKFGPLRLMAGPEGHIFINSASDLLDFDNYDQNFDSLTFGWLAGVGLDIFNIAIDLRYEGNFSNFGDHITFNGQEYEFDDSPSRWLLSVGLFF